MNRTNGMNGLKAYTGNSIRVAMAQLNPAVSDIEGNAEKALNTIKEARNRGAALLVFSELFLVGYPPRDLLWHQSFLERVEKTLHQVIIPQVKGISVLMGAPQRCEKTGSLYNSALLMEEGKISYSQHKTLLPNYDVFDESRYFVSSSFRQVVPIQGYRVGITICEDVWNDKDFWSRQQYSQDPVEELSCQQPDLLISLSASPYHWGKFKLRQNMLSSLARKYRVGVIYVNQVGGNDELIFDGSSTAYSREGSPCVIEKPFQEELLLVEVDELIGEQKKVEKIINSKLEREEKIIEGLPWVKEALLLGIRDYLKKTNFEQVVIGVSGGIDSALTVALAVEALGKDKVLGVIMPSRYTSFSSINDAKDLAINTGIEYRIISIEESFKILLKTLSEKNPWMDLAEENLQARLRGNILMFISNRERRMVLTTGNKSELAVGYCTLYGDMSGGLGVLADVPKTLVYQLAYHINAEADYEVIPINIIEKEPSAELKPDQVDSQSLPPYKILDEILHDYIEENASAKEIIEKGHCPHTVQKIISMIDRAEYKRFQAPPGLKITTRAFGSGRRMPLARGKRAIPYNENNFHNG